MNNAETCKIKGYKDITDTVIVRVSYRATGADWFRVYTREAVCPRQL